MKGPCHERRRDCGVAHTYGEVKGSPFSPAGNVPVESREHRCLVGAEVLPGESSKRSLSWAPGATIICECRERRRQ